MKLAIVSQYFRLPDLLEIGYQLLERWKARLRYEDRFQNLIAMGPAFAECNVATLEPRLPITRILQSTFNIFKSAESSMLGF